MPIVDFNAAKSWAQLNPDTTAIIILLLLMGFWVVYRITKKYPYNQTVVRAVGYGTMLVVSVWLSWGMFRPQPSVMSQISTVVQEYQNVAENGIEVVMLNDNPNPAPGDRIAFMEVQGDKCSYFGVVQPAGYVDINRRTCPSNVQSLETLYVPLNKGPLGTNGQRHYKAYPVAVKTSRETQ